MNILIKAFTNLNNKNNQKNLPIQAVSKLFRIVHLGHKYQNIYLL